ncbi:MAG TPA: N-carbamoylputrescine amidase [Alphaproteobacteria bacterium]|nr:N-carbamoylputrescine amidase [Alphaproteobacteria bacterium]
MARTLSIGIIQTAYGADMGENIAKTEHFIREAAKLGAQVVLPSELFQGIYFCTTQDASWFEHAYPLAEHPAVQKLRPVAKALKIVIPVSIFERDGPHYYNSVAMVDDAGEVMGVYRKSHIPDGPGYCEKFYFRPGDTGYKVWNTRFGTIGVGICWDQWFPECARAMAAMGAEVLLYPTAIGSEPHDASLDTRDPWRRAMQGHAVSNVIPVAASNRIGTEKGLGAPQSFYGSSFIADQRGDLVEDMTRTEEGVRAHRFDLDYLRQHRAAWGFFRDRRGDLEPKRAAS